MAISAFSTLSLLLQIVVLGLLVFGTYLMKRRHDSMKHGLVLTVAVVLNLLSVIFFMVPSYFGSDRSTPSTSDWQSYLLPVHHLIGLIAIIMTLVVVLPWLVRGRSPRGCPGKAQYKKLIMRATFGMFFLSIVLGMVVYLTLI